MSSGFHMCRFSASGGTVVFSMWIVLRGVSMYLCLFCLCNIQEFQPLCKRGGWSPSNENKHVSPMVGFELVVCFSSLFFLLAKCASVRHVNNWPFLFFLNACLLPCDRTVSASQKRLGQQGISQLSCTSHLVRWTPLLRLIQLSQPIHGSCLMPLAKQV